MKLRVAWRATVVMAGMATATGAMIALLGMALVAARMVNLAI